MRPEVIRFSEIRKVKVFSFVSDFIQNIISCAHLYLVLRFKAYEIPSLPSPQPQHSTVTAMIEYTNSNLITKNDPCLIVLSPCYTDLFKVLIKELMAESTIGYKKMLK